MSVIEFEIKDPKKQRDFYKELCDTKESEINKLQHQLKEKDKVIEEKNKCLLEIAKEEIDFINYLKSKGMNFDNEKWINELEEILERGKNANS